MGAERAECTAQKNSKSLPFPIYSLQSVVQDMTIKKLGDEMREGTLLLQGLKQ